MIAGADRYLQRRACDPQRWPLSGRPSGPCDLIVVIPALAESGSLPRTLASLATHDDAALERTLVICVVNNREAAIAGEEVVADNQRTLAMLAAAGRESAGGRLKILHVDASSAGCELPAREGVGLARKIGLDWALRLLVQQGRDRGILACLDADTVVDKNYLSALREFFGWPRAWAAAVAYAHRLDGSASERAAILAYELFLRYHVLGLRAARSPFAFHTIGSTIACSARAYVAAGGMRRRQAAEDFYFLQELAKTGSVATLSSTIVAPAARASTRVPFGTGARIARYLAGDVEAAYRAYDHRSYLAIGRWLEAARRQPQADAEALLAVAADSTPELARFLRERGFERAWHALKRNNAETAVRELERWFDALATLKAIHHLRDTAYPDGDLFEQLTALARCCDVSLTCESPAWHDQRAQEALLWELRRTIP